jgi:hypothetical protein
VKKSVAFLTVHVRRRRRGFAPLELPIVLLLLVLGGLLVAFVFSFFVGPVPWYAWIAAGLTLPIAASVMSVVLICIERLATRREARETQRREKQREKS